MNKETTTRKNIGIYYLSACKPEDFYLKTDKSKKLTPPKAKQPSAGEIYSIT